MYSEGICNEQQVISVIQRRYYKFFAATVNPCPQEIAVLKQQSKAISLIECLLIEHFEYFLLLTLRSQEYLEYF